MGNEMVNYDEAVSVIKTAILQSQYAAAKSVNEKQLMLYYGIGKYISFNSRKGFWGKGAVDAISEKLQRQMPGLRGYSARNLRNMRQFYEEWSLLEADSGNLAVINAKTSDTGGLERINPIWQLQLPKQTGVDTREDEFPMDAFWSIGFTQHVHILTKVKDYDERIYYIKHCANEHYTVDQLKRSIISDDYHHQANLPNNFYGTLPAEDQAFRAVSAFKDEYLLDYINVEEAVIRDKQELTERVVENEIVHNIKKFILTFGKGFAFIGNQYNLEAFGVDQYIDLLFFNRKLNCLVAVELKTGKFRTSYLGELQGYLSILDGFERMPHENPSIGLILCKDMEKSFVDYVIQDYNKPMGVATYKTAKDMSEELKNALPDIEELKKLLDNEAMPTAE